MTKTQPAALGLAQRRLLDELADQFQWRGPAVAFTGAGISTESGIPDYRGPRGLWTRRKPTKYKDFIADPELRAAYWQRRRTRYPAMAAAEPNAGHIALRRLQDAGLLTTIITQNIDGLHQKAGSDPDSVIELHGSVHEIQCVDCGTRFDAKAFPIPEDGSEPSCPVCGGIVKEGTISFGQSLDVDVLRKALEIGRTSDLMIVVGSSLQVNPAAKIPQLVVSSGGALAIINNEPTPLDAVADWVIHASAGAALVYLADLLAG